MLTPLILILGASSVLDYRLARQTSDSAHDQALADSVFDLESHIRSHHGSSELDLTQESEAMLRSNAPDKIFFSIRNPAGQLLAGDSDIPDLTPPRDDKVTYSDGLYQNLPVRIAQHKVSVEGGAITITVMETTQKRKQSRQRILTAMLLPNLAVVFATLLAVLFGVRRGLLPLDEVEREIASRSPNDLRQLDLNNAPREIKPMLHRLNELFSLLRDASEAQNRFIADAAHQLRTPLAGLQTQLDLAVSEGAFSSNEGRLQNIEESTDRLVRLLGQLLSYARAEASLSIANRQEAIHLEQIVEKSASTFLDAALSKSVDLGFEIQPAAIVGTPWLLQEALGNLIDNAIRYTPHGGIITVRCGEEAGLAFLEVEDNGPGIDQEHRAKVFERFYRIPGSASNGCGLGLPIVKEIAELHGAAIHLLGGHESGLRVRLEFEQRPLPG